MNWLVKKRLVRPWAILKVQIRMGLQWIVSPTVYLRQRYITCTYDTVLFGIGWLIIKREYVYLAWEDGQIEFVDMKNPTYRHMLPLINKLHGRTT